MLVALAGCCSLARAQDAQDEFGNWLIYNGTVRFSDRWTLFTEGQVRLYEVASSLNEIFGRVAGHYDVTPKAVVGLGYMRSGVWTFGGPNDGERESTEDRLYAHFAMKHFGDRTIFEHRYRYEWRSIDRTTGPTEHRNRLRYRIQVTVPLNRKKMEPGATFFNGYDEIFVNTGSMRAFDQNRFYVAAGRQFTPHANLQLGLLWQARSSEDFYRLQVFYTHNFDLRRQ